MTAPKKSFGQHFLRDESVARRIVEAAELQSDSFIVEVGPGDGALTKEIVKVTSKLILIEADRDLVNGLKSDYTDAEIIEADAARVDFNKLTSGREWVMLSNLPYNAANAIIMNALECENTPQKMVVMVQREVADRILARPGKMSLLSVAVQMLANPKRLFDVKPDAFNPQPKVMSTVIEIVPKAEKFSNFDRVIRFAKVGFSSRRKQLHNNLSAGHLATSEQVINALESMNISPKARAQELSINDWKSLAEKL